MSAERGPDLTLNYPFDTTEEQRLLAIQDIEACNPGGLGPNVDRMLEVLRRTMHVETACVVFIRHACLNVRQAKSDMIEQGHDFGQAGICFWTLVSEYNQVMVVEDMQQDARTANSLFVIAPPHLRFYAASPLVTRSNQRIGTLCLVDTEPTKFGSARAAVLSNCAELLMWELERAVMAQMPESPVLVGEMRDKKLYSQAVALVDTSDPGWRILFANQPFTDLAGGCADGTSDFWSLVKATDEEKQTLSKRNSDHLESLESFEIPKLLLKSQSIRSKGYNIELRPAMRSQIHEDANEVGNPARYAGDEEADLYAADMKNLFFLLLRPSSAKGGSPRFVPPIDHLTVGTALGAGSFGKVYRGTLSGEKVAVKVVKEPADAIRQDGLPLEARLMQDLQHPNIVGLRTFKMAQTRAGNEHLWLVLHYCDKGTLADALVQGWFKTSPSQSAPYCLPRIMITALEMATGLEFLHAHSILHCDLSGGNVLLHSNDANPHGFIVRLADFGSCRRKDVTYEDPPSVGNYSYLAPEIMKGEPCSEASDVFSLGVLIFEMLTGKLAWCGMNPSQISYAVLYEGQILQLHDDPDVMGTLALDCMNPDPPKRPTAAAIVSTLRRHLAGAPSEEATMKPDS